MRGVTTRRRGPFIRRSRIKVPGYPFEIFDFVNGSGSYIHLTMRAYERGNNSPAGQACAGALDAPKNVLTLSRIFGNTKYGFVCVQGSYPLVAVTSWLPLSGEDLRSARSR